MDRFADWAGAHATAFMGGAILAMAVIFVFGMRAIRQADVEVERRMAEADGDTSEWGV